MGELKGREEMGVVAVVGLLGKVVVTACGFGLIFLGFDYSTVLIAFPIGGFASLAAAYVVSRVRLGPLTLRLGPRGELKKMLVEVLPFGFAFVLVQGIYCQDVIILRFFKGDASVGVYSVAVKFTAFILAGSVFLYETILPILSKLYVESRDEFMRVARQILRYLVICSLPLAAGMAALADRIIALLYQDRFTGSVAVLRVAAWVVTLGMTQVIYSAILTAVNRQGAKAVCWGISLVIAIGANLALIRPLDFMGAAIVRLAIETLTLVAFAYLTLRYAGSLSLLKAHVKPALACAVMAAFIHFAHDWNLAALVALSGIIYVVMTLALGTFSRAELRRFRDFCAQRVPALGTARR
jgi:O-antigen/teichoic acid export membrane protein